MKERFEMPWKVKVHSPHVGITVHRNGTLSQTTWRYFATRDEALKFCGDAKLIKYAPGEAFRYEEI